MWKSILPEPLIMTSMPERPWDMVHIDFLGLVPTKEYLLVIIDRYSRFPEAELLKSTWAIEIIPHLDRVFSVHGIPREIKPNIELPFNGVEFANYIKALEIKYQPGTLLWPQGKAGFPLGGFFRAQRSGCCICIVYFWQWSHQVAPLRAYLKVGLTSTFPPRPKAPINQIARKLWQMTSTRARQHSKWPIKLSTDTHKVKWKPWWPWHREATCFLQTVPLQLKQQILRNMTKNFFWKRYVDSL